MKFVILGAGGVGSYYGVKLLNAGHDVIFVARGNHLEEIQKNGLKLQHPDFIFDKHIKAIDLDNMSDIGSVDAILITTKSTATKKIAKDIYNIFDNCTKTPYIVSLQNGVQNEDILCQYFPEEKIIGGLSRKIGAHIIKPGIIEVKGKVETIIGAIKNSKDNNIFMIKFSKILNENGIRCEIVEDIKLELWKKLIINNGVNAICALLRIKTGTLMRNKKLSKIVYNLMSETVQAAKYIDINIEKNDLDSMFELIKNFDSIKPSMLVDVEQHRGLELDEICNIVINYCDLQGLDAPYTRTISTLLEFTYNKDLI